MNSFEIEIKRLSDINKNQGHVKSDCKILNLNPFLDNDGVLRVGGRLAKSELPYDTKHPIILPKRDRFTTLLIDDSHHVHGGAQVTPYAKCTAPTFLDFGC